jgi:hypothetical protein
MTTPEFDTRARVSLSLSFTIAPLTGRTLLAGHSTSASV